VDFINADNKARLSKPSMAGVSKSPEGRDFNWTKLVFRLRRLPPSVLDKQDAAELLGQALPDISPADINILSLACGLDGGIGTKVATLRFSRAPRLLDTPSPHEGWPVPLPSPDDAEGMIIDHHFRGMTPLVDASTDHTLE